MNKYLFILLVITSYQAQSEQLEISSVNAACIEINERGFYRHAVDMVVKNISDTDLKIITKVDGAVVIPAYNEKPTEITLSKGENSINEIPIIPTEYELGVVTLKSGEGALVHHKFTRRSIEKVAVFQYQGVGIYGGRYNNWVGLIKSSPTAFSVFGKCKP